MESMDMSEQVTGSNADCISKPALYLWYLHGSTGIKTTTLKEVNLKETSIRSLKEIAGKSGECFTTSVDEIDILHNGIVLQDDGALSLEALNVRPNSVLHVVKKLGTISKEKDQAYKRFQSEPKKISSGMISELVIALKTMILSPAFITTIEKLSDPQMLRNILAVVPNLQFDPVGIAIIQDPSMILYLADEESLKALSKTRPWVVEAFSFISATIHQQEAAGSRGTLENRNSSGLNSLLSYFRQSIDEDGEDDDEGAGASGGPATGQPSSTQQTITRQQLVAALDSFNNLRGLSVPAGQQAPPSSRLPQPPTQTSTPRLGTNPLSAANQRRSEPSFSNPGSGSSTPPPLTGELVARAMREALSQLPPDQRNAQMNAFRNLAMSLNQQQSPPQTVPSPAPPVSNTTVNPSTSNASNQYRAEVAQMRDLGILDENLSIMALRISDGDVATAVDLIFSGWNGEGFE